MTGTNTFSTRHVTSHTVATVICKEILRIQERKPKNMSPPSYTSLATHACSVTFNTIYGTMNEKSRWPTTMELKPNYHVWTHLSVAILNYILSSIWPVNHEFVDRPQQSLNYDVLASTLSQKSEKNLNQLSRTIHISGKQTCFGIVSISSSFVESVFDRNMSTPSVRPQATLN